MYTRYLRIIERRISPGRVFLSFLLAIVAYFPAPSLAVSNGGASADRIVGLYVHQHWPYNHPYAARTWTFEDWRGFAGGLKQLGYNTVLVWPMLETIPDPP